MQTFTLAIQKMPGGGYAMSYALDGQAASIEHAHAARSLLHEVFQDLVHPIVAGHFKEAPVYQRVAPPPMSEPVSQMFPATPRPPEPQPFDQEGMPAVVEQMAAEPPRHQNGGLMDRFGGYRNGVGAWVPALFLAACWASLNLPRLMGA
jgi:hypothetical protein